jgi:GNAT superfamily N-acetyltransferase
MSSNINKLARKKLSTIDLIESSLFDLYCLFKDWPAITIHNDKDVLFTVSDIPFPIFNSILDAKFSEENASKHIEHIKSQYSDSKIPLLWWISPSDKPSSLSEKIQKHGFSYSDEAIGMAMELDTLVKKDLPNGVTIELVKDTDMLKVWCDTLIAGYELPEFVSDIFYDFYMSIGLDNKDIYNYIAMLDGKPVATSSVLFSSGVAGIYNVSTMKNARKKGIGSAITTIPLLMAKELNYSTAVLQSSKIGQTVYEKLGFIEYCRFQQYIMIDNKPLITSKLTSVALAS